MPAMDNPLPDLPLFASFKPAILKNNPGIHRTPNSIIVLSTNVIKPNTGNAKVKKLNSPQTKPIIA